ncbi:unnamed protein product, partial [Mycena citricolor]
EHMRSGRHHLCCCVLKHVSLHILFPAAGPVVHKLNSGHPQLARIHQINERQPQRRAVLPGEQLRARTS